MTLDFNHVSFRYPEDEKAMFENLSFHVGQGEFTSLIGASGSGKSTIFRLINRFLIPDAGHVLIDGEDIRECRADCGYMPQRDLLFPWKTVEENVMIPLRINKIPKKERRQRAAELLRRVGLEGSGKKYPKELSGGMRQRAAFARTLSTGADLLLLDEPFSALDSITRVAMQEWLRQQWKKLYKTILLVTHDVEEAIFLSQRILVLTGRPVEKLIEVQVPLPEERDRSMLMKTEILELKEYLIELLREEALT